MDKPKSLRTAIENGLPEFKRDPARLKVWIEDGRSQSNMTPTLAFAFRYRLNVLLEESTSDIALVALAIFRWLRVNQPNLMVPGAAGFSFDADFLDNKTVDILIQLELTESVTVAPREEGGWTLNYLPEPDPLFDDEQPPLPLPPEAPISELTGVVTVTVPSE